MAKKKSTGTKSAGQTKPVSTTARKKATPARVATSGKKTAAGKKGNAAKAEKLTGASATSATSTDAAPVLYALVIGCDFYLPNSTPEGSYPSLEGCVADAEQIERFLRTQAGLTDDRLVKLTSTANGKAQPKEPAAARPTYENIVAGFKTILGRAKKGDHVFVHYSGHGGRCPTILPRIKGNDGLDEGLVPIDIGNSSARYVRDVEIAKLLAEMSKNKLVVTVVFDCCHSGGATRAVVRKGGQVGVRGVEFVDRTRRPESLVGSIQELEAAESQATPRTRGGAAVRGMAASAVTGACVVLAACRPSELAREFAFDGQQMQGALTYWFLLMVGQRAGSLSFRTVYDAVQSRIHGQFTEQTPMLFGDADRLVLGGIAPAAAPSISVSKVSADGKTLTLASGQAGLIGVGTEFAIYPSAATDLTDAAGRTAGATVTAIGATTATAEVTLPHGTRKIEVGDRAVPVGIAQKLKRKVRVALAKGAPASTAAALADVDKVLKRQSWVEPAAGPEDAADFIVTTTRDARHYQICDAGGVPLDIRPEVATGDAKAVDSVVGRLVHLARFQAIRGLDNADPFAPLRGKLLVELFAVPPGYEEGGALDNLKPFPRGPLPRVKNGTWLVVSVTNQSALQLNAVILDLASNWEVSIAHKDEAFHPIEAGSGPWLLPLCAGLPDGRKTGKDVLKVIATVDPPPTYQDLTLPPLDKPMSTAAQRGATTRSVGPRSPLQDLMAAVGADRPTRALSTGSQPTRGWVVAHVEVEIENA